MVIIYRNIFELARGGILSCLKKCTLHRGRGARSLKKESPGAKTPWGRCSFAVVRTCCTTQQSADPHNARTRRPHHLLTTRGTHNTHDMLPQLNAIAWERPVGRLNTTPKTEQKGLAQKVEGRKQNKKLCYPGANSSVFGATPAVFGGGRATNGMHPALEPRATTNVGAQDPTS